ncbi:MAG TPA: hypothetical protein PLK30_19285 [Blastocatellia bacterium]|nr:hypothetical protein [Blastocatellia bacterium]
MNLKSLVLVGSLLLIAPAVWGQTAGAGQVNPPEEQNETMLDTLRRMKIKREEEEHKKLLSKGFQIKQDVQAIAKEAVNGRLPQSADKRLKDIEKSAKQIRTEFGGSKDEELESPPKNLDEALKQLSETSTQLNDRLAKTSRQVISISVVESATDIVQLVKILRTFMK